MYYRSGSARVDFLFRIFLTLAPFVSPISSQSYSLLDDEPPRPLPSAIKLPDCYAVSNVAPIESKMGSFNEETLFWIFYSCPLDIKQHLAATEL